MVKDVNKNMFIRVQFHWSEDPRKDEKWYQEQCQELSDKRLINQELDLLFVGGSDCIFDDDLLASLKHQKPTIIRPCLNASNLDIFVDQLDPTDYYLIGCDTAESLTGAYCAIEIFGFREFNQVAELQTKFGSYTAFGQVIHEVFQWLYRQVGSRIILVIENNTINN